MNNFYSYIEDKINNDNIAVDQSVMDKMRRVCDGLESMYEYNIVQGVAVTNDDKKITLHIFGYAFDIASEIKEFIEVLESIDGFYIYNDKETESFSLSFEFEL